MCCIGKSPWNHCRLMAFYWNTQYLLTQIVLLSACFSSYSELATWQPRNAFMRALMSSCWQPIRSERSVVFSFCALWDCFIPHPTFSVLYTMPFLFFFYLFLSQDLSSPNQYDTGVALTGLSCFVTPDLARDLANDIMTLVSHGGYVQRVTNKGLPKSFFIKIFF